jgi:hypothetical protein
MVLMMDRSLRLLMSMVVISVVMSVGVFAGDATNVECGGTISESVTLDGDLDCSGEGGYYAILVNTDDITISCNGETISGDQDYGIRVDSGAEGVVIENCKIEGFDKNGIYSYESDGLTIDNVIFSDNVNRDVYTSSNSENVKIIDSEFHSTAPYYQIAVAGGSGHLIEGNNFYNSGLENGNGFSISFGTTVSGSKIVSNNFYDVNSGVYVYYSDGEIEITDNSFVDFDDKAIFLFGGDGMYIVDSNIISSNGQEDSRGVYISGLDSTAENSEITNNKISGVDHGIYMGLSTSEGITFEGNQIYNSSYAFYTDSAEDSDLTFTSNYFCSSEDYDFYCDAIGTGNSGSGNFMDSVYECQTTDLCGLRISDDNAEYKLEADVLCGYRSGYTIEIEADDVLFDCNGFSVSGDTASDYIGDEGFYVSGDNVEIKNCKISKFDYGVRAVGSGGNKLILTSNDIYNNYKGVHLNQFDAILNGNSIVNNYNLGLDIGGSSANDNIEMYDNVICQDEEGVDDISCSGLGSYAGADNVFTNTHVSCMGIEAVSECSGEGNYALINDAENIYFPNTMDSTYSCFETSHSSCKDGVDNDNNGLIDCMDDGCNLMQCDTEDNSYACVENECVKIVLPEAETATLLVKQTYVGYLWTYFDLLDWLNSATVYHENGVCNEICSNYDQECLFADAGRNLCSNEGSEKCTCI